MGNPAIRGVLFDLGGVVFRFDPAPRLAALAARSPLPADEIEAVLWGSGFSDECDRGRYGADEHYREAVKRAQLDVSYEELRDAWCLAFTPDAEVIALVDRLRRRFRVAMLTNNAELILEGLTARWPDVLGRFVPCVFAFEIGVLKPDPAAFRAALSRMGLAAGEVLFVDDSERNVEGGRRVELDAVRFIDAVQLERELAARALI